MQRYLLVFLLAAGCASRPVGLTHTEFGKTGSVRSYELFVPARMTEPAPLVVALHRFTESGKLMANLTGFNAIAEREGFVVVYPDGPGSRFEAFKDGPRDDVAFVLAVIDDVARKVPIDRRRIYVTGASNGAFLTHRLACLKPDVFAAAAPVMGLMPANVAKRHPDGVPVPMLIVHGTADWIVKEDAQKVFAGASYEVMPMQEAIAYWVRRNGADPQARTERLEDVDPEDKTRVTLYLYAGNAEVRYYRVEGGGHTWPGGTERAPTFIVGRTSRDFSASEVIWEFFKDKRR